MALVLFIAFVIVVFFDITQGKKVDDKEQQNITYNAELPQYLFENSSGYDYNLFKYSNLEFSSYTNKDDFYGLYIIDKDKSFVEMYVYCKINESRCDVEFKDLRCLETYFENIDVSNITLLGTNEINCSRYYTIKGNVSERIY